MSKITKPQQLALKRLRERDLESAPRNDRAPQYPSYLAMRRAAHVSFGDCLMVKMWGMWLGIEAKDGYTHS